MMAVLPLLRTNHFISYQCLRVAFWVYARFVGKFFSFIAQNAVISSFQVWVASVIREKLAKRVIILDALLKK
ncbi:hypothetical protein IQ264_25635 [Phormidium sp. LEGE 05292]|uniref:hypothetical protein n=1 Tax=[Phormidium] sp. LEGE 05292 TaxID=767427 RepID=UPI00187E2D55|nr:hypothetical protein [Phormidium sp. LEGE 05292]MBE9228798.1 hypothetical protein [Phormidium sp. LEGE 05292]